MEESDSKKPGFTIMELVVICAIGMMAVATVMGSKYNPPSDAMMKTGQCLKELAAIQKFCETLKQKGLLPAASDRGKKKDSPEWAPVYSGNAALLEAIEKKLGPECDLEKIYGVKTGVVAEGPLAGKKLYLDPWGSPLIFKNPAPVECFGFAVYSAGIDGFDDGGMSDDVALEKKGSAK